MLAGVHQDMIGRDHVQLVFAELLQQRVRGSDSEQRRVEWWGGMTRRNSTRLARRLEGISNADIRQDLALLAVVDDIQHLRRG